jgi:Arsenate reductase and related proteins, glutaredoxin family
VLILNLLIFVKTQLTSKPYKLFVDVLGWDKVINKRSTTYRNLSDREKQNITLALTLKNPTLIKRPVLVTGSDINVGFNEKLYLSLI